MATTELQVPVERELMPAGHKIGRFTLLTRLGVGAMGVVYSAYDPELDRRIAVKLLRAPEGGHAARAQARLLREAQAMARLNHPNVVVVHDVGTHERDVFVAMEFIRGHTLQAWQLLRPRKWSEIVEVYVQAGRGLAAAHAVGLVHRDFKASNAMVGDDGRVRVLDFGLCHAELSGDSLSTRRRSRRRRAAGGEPRRGDRRDAGLHGAGAVSRAGGGGGVGPVQLLRVAVRGAV
jgi:serine/threonine protein kinase